MPSKVNSNVAVRNIILTVRSRGMGYDRKSKAKLLTVGPKFFTVRYLPSEDSFGFQTITERFPMSNDKVIYESRWPHNREVVHGMDKVLEIHQELYGSNE